MFENKMAAPIRIKSILSILGRFHKIVFWDPRAPKIPWGMQLVAKIVTNNDDKTNFKIYPFDNFGKK